jgi:hypothetical protein
VIGIKKMKRNKTLTLKIDETTLTTITDRALKNYRSIARETLYLIAQALNTIKESKD